MRASIPACLLMRPVQGSTFTLICHGLKQTKHFFLKQQRHHHKILSHYLNKMLITSRKKNTHLNIYDVPSKEKTSVLWSSCSRMSTFVVFVFLIFPLRECIHNCFMLGFPESTPGTSFFLSSKSL